MSLVVTICLVELIAMIKPMGGIIKILVLIYRYNLNFVFTWIKNNFGYRCPRAFYSSLILNNAIYK